MYFWYQLFGMCYIITKYYQTSNICHSVPDELARLWRSIMDGATLDFFDGRTDEANYEWMKVVVVYVVDYIRYDLALERIRKANPKSSTASLSEPVQWAAWRIFAINVRTLDSVPRVKHKWHVKSCLVSSALLWARTLCCTRKVRSLQLNHWRDRPMTNLCGLIAERKRGFFCFSSRQNFLGSCRLAGATIKPQGKCMQHAKL